MADESILNLIVDYANEQLLYNLQYLVEQSDETRGGLVRAGLLQDDPLKNGINILTHIGDPEDELGWRHTIVRADTLPHHSPPPYMLGGGEMWHRKFTTELMQFFKTSVKRARARELASVILSRTEHAIRTMKLGVGPDSFGEFAFKAFVHSSINTEAGGDGQFIWRGRIWWICLTEINY